MRARNPLLYVLLVLLGFGCFASDCKIGGCDGGDSGGCGDNEETEDPCDRPFTGASLDGKWEISANGTRSDCKERRLEGHLSVETTLPLDVSSQAQATFNDAGGPEVDNVPDQFVQRIERADFELSGEKELPKTVRFSGQVRGACVMFTLDEELPDGDHLHYELMGALEGEGAVRGTFTGTGPETCQTRGGFTARVR